MANNKYVRQSPTDRQQQFLLHTDTREVFYGGAGGGGKSTAGLIAALQFVHVPGYAALILRRTYTDLALPGALIDRAHSWLDGTDARWNDRDKRWVFPSGATVSFGYLETDADKYRYQSSEFHFLFWDELTQFGEGVYRFMFSRLRRAGVDVPLRVRAASNPGGVGHAWVKGRFIGPDAKTFGRTFIPAKMTDNPHLDQKAYGEALDELDPVTRAQIKDGCWDDFAGGRFKPEWLRRYRRHLGGYTLDGADVRHEDIREKFVTVDPAASVPQTAKADPDWTVAAGWHLTKGGELLWPHCLRLRCEVPDIPRHVWAVYERTKATVAYVEGGGPQKAVAQLCRRFVSPDGRRMNVHELNPSGTGDKLVRATPLINLAEQGRLWLPGDDATFPFGEVAAELTRFTGGKGDGHDDIVDAAAWAARVAEGKVQSPGFAPYFLG